MKKKNYVIIAVILILVFISVFAISLFIFQGDEEDICHQCKMLNCHDHASGDNYCCNMCSMEKGSKCNCPMPMKEDNNSNVTVNSSVAE
ncbi:hypothetical protein KQY27_01405 [Methanobrevibacter sp. TMH8]|uniref:hypothetical protein n=1 Tax=Methanobrevibacter sp. TMH8 TaxID=2848611 RepID=UPI001CCBA719|nr:hypothetical protein [Methanobrevibacter sp. TMH8]MBZ9570205.1 hypothetical protein [Methanobrevibacter sp. TMH8]